jgi:acyl carrier protein
MTEYDDETTERIMQDLEAVVRELGRISTQESGFTRESNLFFDGYLDSLGVMALIAHLEKTHDIRLGDEALADERFGSVRGIGAIVAQQLASRRSAWT